METNKNNDIDVRKVVRTVWKHWWWFAIGVVFFLLMGILYYLRKNPTWNTEASIVLRQGGEFGGLSDQIGSGLAMLGLGGNAAGEDEVVVLSSRDLMAQAIDALNLWEYSYVKDKMRWKGEFRNPAMTIDYIQLTEDAEIYPFSVKVYPSKRGYKVKTRLGYFISSSKRVKDLNEPIETAIGTIRIHANRPLSTDTAYKVVHKRHELVVADFRELVNVALHKKESNIIKLSMRSAMPERDRVLLHQLIEQYNLNSVIDKNMLTQNTAGFIEERLNIITAELSEAEKTVSSYKERNNIANIEAQAKLFLEASSEEQRAMAEVETQLSLVDYVDEFLRDENKRNNLIPANIGITDPSLGASLSEYNTVLLQRMRIQRTATESNPVIEQMDAQLASMRQNITASIASVRESLRIRQRNLQEQDSKFNRQIKNAPEQEREYVRVVRDQQIKERLYLFLYEKREENALMLAVSTMPAKILDVPQRDVRSMKPDLKILLLICIFLGLLFPAFVLYVYELFNDTPEDEQENGKNWGYTTSTH